MSAGDRTDIVPALDAHRVESGLGPWWFGPHLAGTGIELVVLKQGDALAVHPSGE